MVCLLVSHCFFCEDILFQWLTSKFKSESLKAYLDVNLPLENKKLVYCKEVNKNNKSKLQNFKFLKIKYCITLKFVRQDIVLSAVPMIKISLELGFRQWKAMPQIRSKADIGRLWCKQTECDPRLSRCSKAFQMRRGLWLYERTSLWTRTAAHSARKLFFVRSIQ